MPDSSKRLIMKFGGAAFKTPAHFSHIAELISKKKLEYPQIVVVVSAMGDMTDQLISLAHQVHPHPPKREYDMLVSAGERISIALLAMALSSKGEKAVSYTGSQSGILTSCEHSEAKIVSVHPHRLLPHLQNHEIVIVAGFQGVSEKREITTLGRGGSDTTAVALGVALGCDKVEFYKDVLGIYSEAPVEGLRGACISQLSYEEALKVVLQTGGQVLHPRAIELAEKNQLPLHVRSFLQPNEGTWIGEKNRGKVPAIYEQVS